MIPKDPDTTFRVAIYTSVACSIAAGIYTWTEVDPAPIMSAVLIFAPATTVILWLQKDAERTGVGSVLDLGLFIWLAWPVVIPWYVLKSRGRRGWRLLLGLLAMLCSVPITSFVTAWLAYGFSLLWVSGL